MGRGPQAYREGRRGIVTYVEPDLWRALRQRSLDTGLTLQAMTLAALQGIMEPVPQAQPASSPQPIDHRSQQHPEPEAPEADDEAEDDPVIPMSRSAIDLIGFVAAFLGWEHIIYDETDPNRPIVWTSLFNDPGHEQEVARISLRPDGHVARFEVAPGWWEWRHFVLGIDYQVNDDRDDFPTDVHEYCAVMEIEIAETLPALPPLPQRRGRKPKGTGG